MAFSVQMPALGESVTEGTVTRWLKQEGDTVAVDEPLLEVSTDKVDTEIPSPVAGIVLEHTAAEDETVEVGAQLALIGPGDDNDATAHGPEQKMTPFSAGEAVELEEMQEMQVQRKHGRPVGAPLRGSSEAAPYVTPLVRKLAIQEGVDLDDVTGTGAGGRITKGDVLGAAEAKGPAQAPAASGATPSQADIVRVGPDVAALRGTTQKASRIRQITATKTRESLQISAQLTQTFEVDMSRIAAMRVRAKASFAEREGINLTFLPFFAKAVVEALMAHPNVNASYNEDSKEITYHGAVHLGVAVDTPQGLLSPVVHDAGDLSLAGLARAIADLARRTRNNQLNPDELSGGTFTITNIGSQGALFDTPILVPPQAAMLGTGAIVKRAVVVEDALGNDAIAVRSMCFLPLTYDHRLVDGADAGRFLTTVTQRLQAAMFAADLGL